ncbi:cobalt-zinc-cadmium efflux system protein [Mariprofundus ferrinatatus]|uniref:Cobalt-zinc-cadmium efflux system protein n=1 Tax=Mariprofundus ferrinatatus TaxID=1921087 RepID=A0A2K8L3U3_9PROT|nr:cation diffusion facilitator family transporter [Mariprofundus ferrinatatus]ATX81957.1 cobalt-zinc-cadmium efflux system protein [Mariprofundus ferrinatatus]
MSGHHGHSHHHHLDMALGLTALFAVVEFAGGWISNSLALLADAVHMSSDVVALGLAAFAGRLAMRPAHSGMTYGYGRARVLAAQANGVALWFLSGWIVWEAFGRLIDPPEVRGWIVIAVGFAGLVVNLVILKWLHGEHDINTRAAYWHVLGDALGSVAAIVAGFVIFFSGWMPIDPILSFLVAGILAWGGWNLLRETTAELMAAAPSDVDLQRLENIMCGTEGVDSTHHVHVWKLPDGGRALSAHVVVENLLHWDQTLAALQRGLQEAGVEHVTLQPESADESCNHHCCEPCNH